MYIDKLDNIINRYNSTYHRTSKMKMKTFNVISKTYIDTSKKINDKDPKLKISGNVRISKYKNIFA